MRYRGCERIHPTLVTQTGPRVGLIMSYSSLEKRQSSICF